MPFLDVNGTRLHYALDGAASAPVLVFSNSLGTDFAMWDPQATALGAKFRILRYDTRGHGQSAVAPRPYSIEMLARDVIALLDALKIPKANFCGLSMGGSTGMWLGANAADRFTKIAISNTAAKIGTAETWGARIEMVRKAGMKPVAAAVIERWFTPDFRANAAATVAPYLKMLESTNPDGYVACCEAVRDFDYREKLANVRVPALVIAGKHDPVTTTADGHFLAEHISGARYAELSAAHLSNIEDGERFTSLLGEFLQT